MQCRVLLVLVTAFGFFTPEAARSSAREPLQKWVVDYDLAQCVASRNYGTADKPLWLVLKSPAVGSVLQIAVLQKSQAPTGYQEDAKIVIDQDQPRRASVLVFRPAKSGMRAFSVNLPASALTQLRAAKALSFQSPAFSETFTLTDMGPLLQTLDDCVADLRAYWNVNDDEALNSTHQVRASGDLSSVFSGSDYPQAAARMEQEGAVRVAMLIDEAGRLADCTVVETSGVALLDAQACALIKERGKFKPAIGVDGKPARDALCQRILWRMRP